jgi:hypothetical protein
MKNTILIFAFLFPISIIAQEYNTFGNEEYSSKEYVFVMRLMPDMSSNLYQLGIMKLNSEKQEIIYLPADSWIRQLIGIESSKANPDTENFIIKHKIFDFNQQDIDNPDLDYYQIDKEKQL